MRRPLTRRLPKPSLWQRHNHGIPSKHLDYLPQGIG